MLSYEHVMCSEGCISFSITYTSLILVSLTHLKNRTHVKSCLKCQRCFLICWTVSNELYHQPTCDGSLCWTHVVKKIRLEILIVIIGNNFDFHEVGIRQVFKDSMQTICPKFEKIKKTILWRSRFYCCPFIALRRLMSFLRWGANGLRYAGQMHLILRFVEYCISNTVKMGWIGFSSSSSVGKYL